MIEVHQFACLSDNYGYLLHDTDSNETVCIDTPDAQAYMHEAAAHGWQITQIWNTHWHPDHAGGNEAIKAATGCKVTAPEGDAEKIAAIDATVKGGGVVRIGEHEAWVLDVGGHTHGHIAYYLPECGIAFVGDSIFALGCGRMFEGNPEQFWQSLKRIRELPDETLLYCAHEYTQANAAFALHADPENAALQDYTDEIAERRSKGLPTVPTRLSREIETNPFLRADNPAMQARWGGGNAVETFAALRSAKDSF